MSRIIRDIPLNRVEGDLTLNVVFENNKVSSVKSVGTLYRGFEKMMRGRGALDGLVITPRICGICSLSHLNAAALALDNLCGVTPPPNAIRIRNITAILEMMQSDIRQTILMFMPDFTNAKYIENPLFNEAVQRYAPLAGSSCISTVQNTSKLVECIAILGGQWPHTSFMVPGGITNIPNIHDMLQAKHILSMCLSWYENTILGCSIERLNEITSEQELLVWLNESEKHRDSDLGFLIRFSESAGLHEIGVGYNNFISYGAFDIPECSDIYNINSQNKIIQSGFAEDGKIEKLDQMLINEYIESAWYTGYEGGRHPFEGETEPHACGNEGEKYTWLKAPRYNSKPAETGALAEAIINNVPLFIDLVNKHGSTALIRQLARITRPARLCSAALKSLDEVTQTIADITFYEPYNKINDGVGVGLTQAARGALGHWIKVENGLISKYQIITPTGWNGSPRDSNSVSGPWEKALEGVKVSDVNNPVELGHIIRSFDPCLVCAVHSVDNGKTVFRC